MSKYIPDTHILWSEYSCTCCSKLPPYFEHYTTWGEIPTKNQLLFTAFEMYRSQIGEGRKISSGYRCGPYQVRLYNAGKTSAPISEHEFGYAFDIDCKDEADVREAVRIFKSLPIKLRIGWRSYLAKGMTFVHIGIGYLIEPIYSKLLLEVEEW